MFRFLKKKHVNKLLETAILLYVQFVKLPSSIPGAKKENLDKYRVPVP